MAELKELFENAEDGVLSYEQFVEAAKEAGAKFKDISSGNYVSVQKYNDDLEAKSKEIEVLNGTISTRDTDLVELQKKLEAAGTDAEKLETLGNDFTKLQTKYEKEVKAYQEKLQKQAYEFAVKSYASSQDFSSEAAKRDFINQMLGADLKMDGDTLIGATDFREAYASSNADAFKVAEPEPPIEPARPNFVAPATGGADEGATMTLSELMKAKNDNPSMMVKFVD